MHYLMYMFITFFVGLVITSSLYYQAYKNMNNDPFSFLSNKKKKDPMIYASLASIIGGATGLATFILFVLYIVSLFK